MWRTSYIVDTRIEEDNNRLDDQFASSFMIISFTSCSFDDANDQDEREMGYCNIIRNQVLDTV